MFFYFNFYDPNDPANAEEAGKSLFHPEPPKELLTANPPLPMGESSTVGLQELDPKAPVNFESLRFNYEALAKLKSQARGYGFEKWLHQAFVHSKMTPREPYQLNGEQLDGSFLLREQTYLVEAKYLSSPVGAAELHTFHGKIEQKAPWARGLFVSHKGFTVKGLQAFGKGKRVLCIDGRDLGDMLERELPIVEVIERKARHAAETGHCFAPVRELFT